VSLAAWPVWRGRGNLCADALAEPIRQSGRAVPHRRREGAYDLGGEHATGAMIATSKQVVAISHQVTFAHAGTESPRGIRRPRSCRSLGRWKRKGERCYSSPILRPIPRGCGWRWIRLRFATRACVAPKVDPGAAPWFLVYQRISCLPQDVALSARLRLRGAGYTAAYTPCRKARACTYSWVSCRWTKSGSGSCE